MSKIPEEGILFISDKYSLYEDETKIGENKKGEFRGIKIIRSAFEDDAYNVGIHILDESLSNWHDKIEMSYKLMEIESESETRIILRGIENDVYSDKDYGLEIFYYKNEIANVLVVLHDKNTKIIYHKKEIKTMQ